MKKTAKIARTERLTTYRVTRKLEGTLTAEELVRNLILAHTGWSA